MAITVTSTTLSSGMPSAPQRTISLLLTLDNSYPNPSPGGYDVDSDINAEGQMTLVSGPVTMVSDGTTPIHLSIVDDSGTFKVRAAVDDTLVEIANGVDLSAYVGVVVAGVFE